MTYRIALIGLLMGGCYAGYGQQQQTLPEPVQVAGPPGGNMDQGYYQNPQDPAGYQQGYQQDPAMGYQGDPGSQQDPNVDPDAQPVDPQQDAAPMADVQDTEIDATLQGYGSWEEDEDYGRVWRPDVTIVGADFTPYDTCGSWGYSEYGWTFNCDYGWGWLPFHYGRWGWIGSSWGWVPGHQWGGHRSPSTAVMVTAAAIRSCAIIATARRRSTRTGTSRTRAISVAAISAVTS